MASTLCPQCGTPLDSRSPFCGNCGYALKAPDAATSYPPQGQQQGGYSSPHLTNEPPPPPPPSYAGGNMSSSPTFPPVGSPPSPYPMNNMSSSPTFPAAGSPPPPPYPMNNPSSSTFPAAGSPSYPMNNMSSSSTFPAAGSPPPVYPNSEPNLPPQKPRRGKKGMLVLFAVVLVVILGGAVVASLEYTSHGKLFGGASTSTPTHSVTSGPTQAPTVATSTPTQSTTPTTTTTAGVTATSSPSQGTATATTSTGTVTTTPVISPSNYSATQPGPGCDSNGGTWTAQGISNITCGTNIAATSDTLRAYLYLQLPNNAAFAASNQIGISSTLNGDGANSCVGLTEQDANTGYLVEYCSGGQWYIYSTSSEGAIVKTLAQSITSTRASEQLLLSLKGTTLSFSIDTEVHKINVSTLQPTKVGISFLSNGGYARVALTNFSYTTQFS